MSKRHFYKKESESFVGDAKMFRLKMNAEDPSPVVKVSDIVEPEVYEVTGGLFKLLKEKLSNFLSNPVSENIVLSSLLVYICS